MDTIRLYRSAGVWHARHEGPHASEILRLFGTDTLETPFLTGMAALEVIGEISRLNPDTYVYAREHGES